MNAAGRSPSPLAGIGLILLAAASFTATDTTTQWLGSTAPLLLLLWVRYGVQAVGTTLVVLPLRGLAVLRTAHPRFQALRGVTLLGSGFFGFLSLRHMPVAEFTAIVMVSPLAITVLAATVLKEPVRPLRWVLVAGGFAGTLVIIRPGSAAFSVASLIPLAMVACNAVFQVLTSRLARTEDPYTLNLYTGWVGTLVLSLVLPVAGVTWPPAWVWLPMLAIGALATLGHLLLILAYRRAPAATLMPYLYLQIGFAMLAGWLVFARLPDAVAAAGMALVAACGVAGAWLTVREGRAARIVPEPVEP